MNETKEKTMIFKKIRVLARTTPLFVFETLRFFFARAEILIQCFFFYGMTVTIGETLNT